ncbi:hypothetical protein GK047_12900 [Paenibacillus sp. SYP-B3998]|uniref:Uncharacterized protein n=1 Tax=Paenibacillus sp. SYP-B3998 TaxID=2678564 RepID=A0A6G3ZZ98_9BACL|nr:hypothetical protein [Paenibacillus sp. SYP-B3998]NEW06901.1 hypothetical protein [Paenibacillus sp. SYP-B3998]
MLNFSIRSKKPIKLLTGGLLTVFAALSIWAFPASAETPAGQNQPYAHGYNANDVKNWSAAADKNAKYLRARVPLATRIPAFTATQAKPSLSAAPQVMNLSADYDNSPFTSFKYNDAYTRNLLNFWQYTDIYASWHGLPVNGSSTTNPNYGVINLPNPAYTDAAHRNGVLSLGCWFWPRSGTFSDWLTKNPDGSYPVADKMIAMAQYYGFDGYFINQEASISSTDAANLMAMLKYLRAHAPANFHLQWYDSLKTNGSLSYVNGFNSNNAPWIVDNGTPVNNSIFMNYAWSSSALTSGNSYAASLGLDPIKALYAGTENDKYGFNPPYDPHAIFPDGGAPRSSWALFGTDMVWNKYTNKMDPNDQDAVYTRERRYWSGPNQDPTNTGRTLSTGCSPYPDQGVPNNPNEYRCWDGVANYIPERSVIGSYPFVSRFNTGHGKAFYLNGSLASSKEWNNASIQDILPSWQWWVKSTGSGAPLSPSLDYTTAYDGGSSLKVAGTLDSTNPTDLRLFKTKLSVAASTNLSITYKTGTASAPSNMKVGLIFEDAPNTFLNLDVGSTTSTDWNTKGFNLGAYAGRTIAAIGLRFESSTSTNYSVNIGEVALTNSAASLPAAPTGFKIDQSYLASGKAEVFLSWNFNPSGVWYYDIYRVKPDNSRESVGRIYDEVFYVKSLERIGTEPTTVLELVTVGFDGAKSSAAQTTLTWGTTPPVASTPIDLTNKFTIDGFSYDTNRADCNYDGGGVCYSADLVPSTITYGGTTYNMGSFAATAKNAVAASGQTISLTQAQYTSIRMLGSSVNGDSTATYRINYTDGTFTDTSITMKDWCTSSTTGQDIALSMTHRHNAINNTDQTINTYIFAYHLTPTAGKTVSSITLPSNSKMRLLAISTQ